MFRLHEATQRKLCRIAFVALCIVPTMLLLAVGVRLQSPAHRAAVASDLAQRTGVEVSLDDLLYPRPGQMRLANVRLCDPETGVEIAHIRELEVAAADGRIVVQAAQPKLDARHFGLFWQRLDERILRDARSPIKRLELQAADLTIASPGAESQTLQQVQFVVARDHESTAAELRYNIAGIAMPQPAVLRLTRKASGERESSLQISWQTGGASMPTAPWSANFPWLKQVGKNCRFRGELTAEETPLGWRGELAGELSRIDLEQLVSDQFPHKLSGEAHAIVEQLRFERGRVVNVRGRFTAGPGMIGQSLVRSATEQLSLASEQIDATTAKPDGLRPYTHLALHFTLNEKSLILHGDCANAPQRTALVLGSQMYCTAANPALGPLALVRTLSPASDHQVPATQATRALIQLLPLPEEIVQAEDQPPRGHVRGAER